MSFVISLHTLEWAHSLSPPDLGQPGMARVLGTAEDGWEWLGIAELPANVQVIFERFKAKRISTNVKAKMRCIPEKNPQKCKAHSSKVKRFLQK